MELQDYVRLLRKYWMQIGLTIVGSVAIALVVTTITPKTYTAESQLFVSTSSAGTTSELGIGAQFSAQRVKTYTLLVTTLQVIDNVSAQLGFEVNPDAVSAESPLDTVLVVVSAKDGDPQVAAGIANAVARRLAVLIQDLETPLEEGNMSPVKASVVQTAIAPLAPTSPRPLLNLALGFLLGAAAGVGIALLRESLDVTLKSLDDVMAITGGKIGRAHV